MSDLIKDVSNMIEDAVHLLDVSKLHSSLPKIEECLRDAKRKIDEALRKIEDSRCDHCFCQNDALYVLHCCKCGEFIKYEYKQGKTDLPDCKLLTIASGTSVEEDKAMSSYVRGKYSDVQTSSDEFAIRKEK